MLPVQIKPGIYWVGAIDWNLREFHGYVTQRGSTYNAYLIVDEKITLIDTVKAPFAEEMLSRIAHVVDLAKIDYIISNHVEMDHSGSLPVMRKACPNAKIFTSAPNGVKGLTAHFGDLGYEAVKTGDSLSLGKRTLHFVNTAMVHWPDNMVSYCPEEKIIFSNDAFGQHYASMERFADELQLEDVFFEAKKYYANIVLPYGPQVQKALAAVLPLDIEIIAPSHGLIWRSHLADIIERYKTWSANESEEKALVIYDTMWHSTEKMAQAILEGFERKGVPAQLMSLQHHHISDIMTPLMTAKYICVGSPTLNNNMLPTVASFLTYMKGLAPKNRMGLAFGSYGWGGQSVGQVQEALTQAGFEPLDEMIRIQWIPTEVQLQEITERIAAKLP